MEYTNSKLVDYIKISPNSNPRNGRIDKITIHHTGCVASVEGLGNGFAKPERQASSNYGIGSDGRVGMFVEECNRSWCSSSAANDERAITIEVSNSQKGGNWPVSDNVLDKLIELCVDICQRNDIKELNYTGDASGNLTRHNMFVATTCPGPYLQEKFPYIAQEVNKRLNAQEPAVPEPLYRVIVEGLGKTHAENLAQSFADTGCAVRIEEMEAVPVPEDKPEEPAPAPEAPWVPAVGDIVDFHGDVQYSQANGTTSKVANRGQARIHRIVLGALHPFSLIRTGNIGPYGWVDEGSFAKV